MYTQSYRRNIVARDKDIPKDIPKAISKDISANNRKLGGIGKPLS
jgi:hypothetical protein